MAIRHPPQRRPSSKLLLLAVAVASTLSVAGCAGMGPGPTAAQREVSAMGSTLQVAMAQRKACILEVHTRPEFASLLPHLGDPVTGFSMAQMTDETRPTAKEAALLAPFFDANSGCFRAYVTAIQSVRPDIAVIWENEHTAAKSQVAAPLVERQITWAEAARRSRRLGSETNAQIAAANQRYLAGENVEHQAELNRRAALQMQLMQNMQRTYETQQQTIYQPIQPQRQFHCTSMVMGTLVSTNCN